MTCSVCKVPFVVGEPVYEDPETNDIRCADCFTNDIGLICDHCGRGIKHDEQFMGFEHNDKSIPDHNFCMDCHDKGYSKEHKH